MYNEYCVFLQVKVSIWKCSALEKLVVRNLGENITLLKSRTDIFDIELSMDGEMIGKTDEAI